MINFYPKILLVFPTVQDTLGMLVEKEGASIVGGWVGAVGLAVNDVFLGTDDCWLVAACVFIVCWSAFGV